MCFTTILWHILLRCNDAQAGNIAITDSEIPQRR